MKLNVGIAEHDQPATSSLNTSVYAGGVAPVGLRDEDVGREGSKSTLFLRVFRMIHKDDLDPQTAGCPFGSETRHSPAGQGRGVIANED